MTIGKFTPAGFDADEDLALFVGLDDALVGTWYDPQGGEFRAVYSGERILDILRAGDDGMSTEDAMEYLSFNIEGAWFGPRTPIVFWG